MVLFYQKVMIKRDAFNLSIANYPHQDGDCPRATCYGIYISQLLRDALVCTKVEDFDERNVFITYKLL